MARFYGGSATVLDGTQDFNLTLPQFDAQHGSGEQDDVADYFAADGFQRRGEIMLFSFHQSALSRTTTPL
jgi:hypothetical protein